MNLNLKIFSQWIEYKFEFVKSFYNEFEFERKVSKIDEFIQPYLSVRAY